VFNPLKAELNTSYTGSLLATNYLLGNTELEYVKKHLKNLWALFEYRDVGKFGNDRKNRSVPMVLVVDI
jgi:hypothetical protein